MGCSFHNLVDIKKVQQMLDVFSRFAGVNVAVIDTDGLVLPEYGWKKICSEFHQKNLVSAELCRNRCIKLNDFDEKEDIIIRTCPIGLIYAAAPVIIQGEPAATVIASQFLLIPPALEDFKARARQYGYDEAEYIKAVNELPVISQNHFERISDFIKIFAKMLADLGSERLMQLQEMQKNEKMYRDLFDNAAIMLFTTDMAGRFTSANKYACNYFGYDFDQMYSKTIFDLVSPEDIDMIRSKIDEKIAGIDITTYNIGIKDRIGDKKVIELHTRLIYEGDKPVGIQGAGRDITEQKRIMADLEASEQKFRTLAEHSAAIVYIIKGDRFVYVNPSLVKLTAFSETDLLNMNFWDVVHPDFRNIARQRGLDRQRGFVVPAAYELKLINKKSGAVWIYLTGSRIIYEGEPAIMVSAIDMTEIKRGQEALQESQTLLDHIINFLPDAALVINSEGKILSWNRAMEKLTGSAAKSMLGKGNYEHAIPFYGKRRPMLIDLVLEPDEAIWQYYPLMNWVDDNLSAEFFIPNFGANGAFIWGFATPLYNAQGEMIGAIETIRDVTERKQMENELLNQAESLRMVLEQSPTGTAILDKDQKFVFVNPRLTEITGYTLEDIPTMEVWEHKAYPNKNSRKNIHSKWQERLTAKKRAQGVTRVHCKNGQIREVEFHGIKLPDQRTIVSAWDITWQKQVEESLRAGEQRFRALSDASFEGIILSENGICMEVNHKAIEMFGYSGQEMIGMHILELAAPGARKIIRNHLRNNYELPYEAVGLRKDGGQLPIAIQGRMFEYQGRIIRASAIWDLSERWEFEDEIARQRQNLQALFYNSPDAIALCNVEKIIVDLNPQFCNMFGYTLEDCQGKQLNELIVPEEYNEEYFENRALVLAGEAVQKETVRMDKNGKKFTVILKTIPISDSFFYVMYSDITERKKAEETINEQVKELEAKNAEMERFTYTVSHDLRSPLITIKGFAGLLIDDMAMGNQHNLEKDLQRIISAADKMDDLLRDLLELSRIGRMLNAFSRFSMTEMANEVAELLTGSLYEQGVTLIIAPDMPVVDADRVRIREVLQNILENAIKFMGNQSQPRIEVGCEDGNREWSFFIRDNGIGIESRYHNSIFGLFNKLDPNCEGTGIGLSLAKRIIEFHHGRIWVESAG
ncbi:MAG: PAS domain S-box protein, partial [Syntrophomonas sp.]